MITLGYDDPVMMPSMLIYNTDLMKMYIAGVKEQYDNARADMKDFMKQYGDFYSPIAGDTEAYYNLTTGGANALISDMMSKGVDPYKSPEARNAIARYIAGVPVGTLNLLKRNAEARKTYDENKAKMIADGTYIPGMEDMVLLELGLDNFTSIDPNTGAVRSWDRLSPEKGKTLLELTSPEFLKFGQDEFLGHATNHGAYNKFYSLYGISDPNKAAATDASIKILANSPQGRYYLKQAQARAAMNGTNLRDEITRDIHNANAEFLQPKEQVDQVALKMYEESRADARARAARSSSGGGGGEGGGKPQYSHYTKVVTSSIAQATKGNSDITLKDAQSQVAKNGGSIWGNAAVHDTFSAGAISSKFKQGGDSGLSIAMNSAIIGRLYSVKAVDEWYAAGATGSKKKADSYNHQVRNLLNRKTAGEIMLSAMDPVGKAGTIQLKNDKLGQYTEYRIAYKEYQKDKNGKIIEKDGKPVTGKTKVVRCLFKTGQYEINDEGQLIDDPAWSPEMLAGDSYISKTIAGQSLTNVDLNVLR